MFSCFLIRKFESQNYFSPNVELDRSFVRKLSFKGIGSLKERTRAWHWCLHRCPGQVEFVNYSWRASENCILIAPLGKYAVYISGLLLRMCGLASKLVRENMLSHARTVFYLVFNETLQNIHFKGKWNWSRASESWIALALLSKSLQKLMMHSDNPKFTLHIDEVSRALWGSGSGRWGHRVQWWC